MAKYAEIPCTVENISDAAAELTVYPELPEEQTLWVPLSCIDNDSHCTLEDLFDSGDEGHVSIVKWFCQKNDIPYEQGTGHD